jgi:hypothetical protein
MVLISNVWPVTSVCMQQVSTLKDNKFNTAVARASNVKVSIDGLKTFKDIRRVLKEKPKLDVDTLDNEIPIHKELYVVRDTHPGYLMQAVATMYRMKWLAFVDGSPMFILAHGVEDMDSMYAPKSDGQKARFKATRLLLDGINALADTSLQSDIYSGTGADVRCLPANVQQHVMDSVSALNQGQDNPDTTIDPTAVLGGKLKVSTSPAGIHGVGEKYIDISGSFGSATFRYTDYKPGTGYVATDRETKATFEPQANASYKRPGVGTYPWLGDRAKQNVSGGTLQEVITAFSTTFGINIICNTLPPVNSSKVRPDFDPIRISGMRLSDSLNKLCAALGDYEWEPSDGRFIILRSPTNPKRRVPAPDR